MHCWDVWGCVPRVLWYGTSKILAAFYFKDTSVSPWSKNLCGIVAGEFLILTELEGKWLFCIIDATGCICYRRRIKYLENSFRERLDFPPFWRKTQIAKGITLKTHRLTSPKFHMGLLTV